MTELFVGPLTYRRFMDTFKMLYTSKTKERKEMVEKLKWDTNAFPFTQTKILMLQKKLKVFS